MQIMFLLVVNYVFAGRIKVPHTWNSSEKHARYGGSGRLRRLRAARLVTAVRRPTCGQPNPLVQQLMAAGDADMRDAIHDPEQWRRLVEQQKEALSGGGAAGGVQAGLPHLEL